MFRFWKWKKNFNQYSIKNKVPILILDKNYHDLFKFIQKSEEMKTLEANLNQLLKEQGQLNVDLKQYEKIKKDLMDKILELTTDVFDKHNKIARRKMDKNRNNILKINYKLMEGAVRLESLDFDIKKANSDLLDESVRVCYAYMNKSKQRLAVITPQIERIRAAHKKKLDEKLLHEEGIKRTYSFLHKIVGAELIGKLDKEYEE